MIREITRSIQHLNKQENVRLIRIEANGTNFSAGADLNWMKEGAIQSEDKLMAESRELALLFNIIYNSEKVILVAAKGKVIGGAIGIIAAADIVLSTSETSFAFTEVKLGLVPATIAPYVVLKTGMSVSREWMLTAREIDANEAYARGLTNLIVPESDLDTEVQKMVDSLLGNGPKAMRSIKKLFRQQEFSKDPNDQIDSSSKLIAKFRVSEEGQEGIRSFFEKRQPNWKK
jgi:methylglutaconyl-CoA hydratase